MQIPMQRYKNHEESGKYDITKGTNKALTTVPKEMKIYALSDTKFKIILLKKFSKLHTHA